MKLCTLALTLFFTFAAAANDLMYPPAPAARKAIDIDGRGFLIDGKRTYIASGSLHYARVPHELWRDRLLRMKRAGFNTVETYAFWNYHEPRENEWNFTGDADIGAFLDTAKELGMYATVRVGPYVCAEWDSGGYPIWLKFKPPMKVRTADPEFLKWNDHWYDKILPIVAAHQIHKGGNVIMVQLENEHPKGWGTVDGDPYFDHLHKKAIDLGIEVPYFFSGLNHGHGPAPSNVIGRTTPWYTTEFWPGWFDVYGDISPKRFREVERDNWRILANSGHGHNFYMLHGGTNFDTWNDDSGAASYDYGAAIGQAGDLRPIYYRMKRANYFAQLLPAMREAGAKIKFDANGAKSFENAPIAEGVKLVSCNVRILGVADAGKTITLVVYGPTGDSGKLDFGDKQVSVTFPENGPQEHETTTNGHAIRVVAVNRALADRTWIVGNPDGFYHVREHIVSFDKMLAVVGPSFVRDVSYQYPPDFEKHTSHSIDEGKFSLDIERAYGEPSCGKVIVYGDSVRHLVVKAREEHDKAPAPQLENWQMRLSPEAAVKFDDHAWKSSDEPQQMGADGDISAFAWYRATIAVPSAVGERGWSSARRGKLHFSGMADDSFVFVNGRPDDERTGFHEGQNTIAVLVSHRGRDKAFNYLGRLDNFHRKGLFGPVQLEIGGTKIEVTGWKLRGGVGAIDGDWKQVSSTLGMPAFHRATFRNTLVPGRVLRLATQGTRGTAWLNGHNLGRYPEKIKAPGMYLPECWLKDGENELVVFDEEGAPPALFKLEVEKAASCEVIQVSEPCDPSTPLVVPKDDEPTPPQMNSATSDNVAWKKPATASSSEQGRPPEAANDGDPDTRWCAAGGTLPQWWRVDLQKPYDLAGCEICWENEGTRYQYVVEGSADLENWSVLSDQRKTKSESQIQKLAFDSSTAAGIRYVRITVTGLPKQPVTWASISEVKVTAK